MAKKLRKRSKGSRSRRRQAELDGMAAISPPTSASAYNRGAPAAAVGSATSAAASGVGAGAGMGEQARRCGKDEEYEVRVGVYLHAPSFCRRSWLIR